MKCTCCDKELIRCTHARLHQEINQLKRLMAALEAAEQKSPKPGVVWVKSLISHRNLKPRIDIQVGEIHTQMDADSAVDLAKNIIECCEGSYADAFIFHFIKEKLNQSDGVAAQIISDFRDYREALAAEFRELQKQMPSSSTGEADA